jgi:hypothetical protein
MYAPIIIHEVQTTKPMLQATYLTHDMVGGGGPALRLHFSWHSAKYQYMYQLMKGQKILVALQTLTRGTGRRIRSVLRNIHNSVHSEILLHDFMNTTLKQPQILKLFICHLNRHQTWHQVGWLKRQHFSFDSGVIWFASRSRHSWVYPSLEIHDSPHQ